MLAASENKAISDNDPKVYVSECVKKLGADADAVFASNLLPAPSQFPYEKAEFMDFIVARCKLVDEAVARLCDGKHL